MLDLSQESARTGDLHYTKPGGEHDKIGVVWRPEHKAMLVEYAKAKGWSFNALILHIVEKHAVKEAKKRGWRKTDDLKKVLTNIKGRMKLAPYIRGVVLSYIDKNPLRALPKAPREEDLPRLAETRPDALVYAIPVNCVRIVAAPDGEGGWRGVIFDPAIVGSTSTWHSSHLNPPVWAKTPTVLKSLAFVASRIDMDGLAYFQIPQTSIKVAAEWDPGSKRFERGEVIDTKANYRQKWQRGGWYSAMPDPKGPFNMRPNVRKVLNMLCRTMTVGDGGITANVPSH